ncbi:MAG: trypsin-like peptidase domain-containing protein [Blastocatellia bacterium]|nr:trypsin-like peptidase domain-containing protein [Blastocatellia bacterium]
MLIEVFLSRTFSSQSKLAAVLMAILMGLPGASGHAAYAQVPPPATPKISYSTEVREQIKKVIPGIGLVLVRNANDPDQKLRPRGSAVIVRKDGLVITNFHVIARDRSTRTFDEIFLSLPSDPSADAATAQRQLKLKIVLLNQERDLALLRVVPDKPGTPMDLPYIVLGDSYKVELLDDVFIIGFPEKGGTTVTVNPGVVEGKDALDDWIKTNGRLLHGNSGGAAVNSEGKLIGVPTRVVVDSDSEKTYGSVGYLRPAHLVAAMISKHQEAEMNAAVPKPTPTTAATPNLTATNEPRAMEAFVVRGTVKSAAGQPLAGVRVGLLLVGKEVAASNLITWGGSNAEGQFTLEKPVPPGRYNLRARVIGYEAYSLDVDISSASVPIAIELKPVSKE